MTSDQNAHMGTVTRHLAQTQLIGNLIILDALWTSGTLSYEDTLKSIETIRTVLPAMKEIPLAVTLLAVLERSARDGIAARDRGDPPDRPGWNPEVIRGGLDQPPQPD